MVSTRLIKEESLWTLERIGCPEDAVRIIGPRLSEYDREVFCVVNLTTRLAPINATLISIGSLNSVTVAPREVFKASILSNASSVLLMHNHPSNDLTPSSIDIQITDLMIQAGGLLGISVRDHIIVGTDAKRYYSFSENKELNYTPIETNLSIEALKFANSKANE